LAEDIEGEESVDDGVAGDDPFVRSGEDFDFGGVGVDGPFESFDCGGATADNKDLLAFGVFAIELGRMVDFAFEVLLTRNVWHLGSSAGAYSSEYTIEAAIGRVIDDPTVLFVLVDLLYLGVESGLVFELVSVPKISDLLDDLRLLGVPSIPVDGRVEAVHKTVDLKTRCRVDIGPNSSDMVRTLRFEEDNVEAMTDTMTSSRNACKTGSYNSDLGTL
jgi:hypothetical protein